ncbi:hypothetical protein CDL12_22063 [Handroanthus impetiginosus]|uniref:Uncharacterized protein n=1 Tax=Handroanthus impetiginosus TaxID=429701 RepID=A0A2G9GJE5_9LAMI|nr:hypothetical protein CDL12_22063 [Handroanthus impetiginosus]
MALLINHCYLNFFMKMIAGYDEGAGEDSSFSSPLVADIWKRSASFRWSEKGQSSFRSIKKRLQEATWR